MFAVTGRSRLKDFSRMASGKLGPSKDGRHASFNMKSITLTDGCLPIVCFQERSLRPSRTVKVLRRTYSNASPFRSNRPKKNEASQCEPPLGGRSNHAPKPPSGRSTRSTTNQALPGLHGAEAPGVSPGQRLSEHRPVRELTAGRTKQLRMTMCTVALRDGELVET
jgi:hypothetical protein